METLTQCGAMSARILRQLIRQPLFIVITLAQPLVWLLLYGQLFRNVALLPGFPATSYIAFLTPGIVIMSSLFSSGWTGLGILNDIDAGVMERFLCSPVARFSILTGRLASIAVTILLQAIILLFLGWLLGVRYLGGFVGVSLMLMAAVVLGMGFGSLSIAMALKVRKQESVIGAMNLLLLPLTFLSGTFMATNLMPSWMRSVATVNPINWAVEIGRLALDAHPLSSISVLKLCFLALFVSGSWILAGWSFRAYQAQT
jgi:ABC-2 type transport system permease protein